MLVKLKRALAVPMPFVFSFLLATQLAMLNATHH
jgi:hypothetical protein